MFQKTIHIIHVFPQLFNYACIFFSEQQKTKMKYIKVVFLLVLFVLFFRSLDFVRFLKNNRSKKTIQIQYKYNTNNTNTVHQTLHFLSIFERWHHIAP